MAQKAHHFLTLLWGGEDPEEFDSYLLIFTIDQEGKTRSAWFRTIKEAADYAGKIQDKHVYFGVGLSPENFGQYNRCVADKVTAWPGLALDIDVQHPTHKKENLFRSREDAISFVKDIFPPHLNPSAIVNSGHGLQVWWVFKEPEVFETDIERAKLQKFLRDFNYTVGSEAESRYGVSVDSVFDMARVLRLPGSRNIKDPDDPKEVTILETTDNTFIPDDFEQFLEEAPASSKTPSSAGVKGNYYNLVLSEHVDLEPRLNDIIQHDLEFKRLWDLQRRDFQYDMSSYDMALANKAVACGFKPQEIADMIIVFRRTHAATAAPYKQDRSTPDDVFKKALRVTYINNTIWKAREKLGHDNANEAIDNQSTQLEQHRQNPHEIEKPPRDETIKNLQEVLQIKITAIWKYLSDPPFYEMELEDGRRFEIGPARTILDPAKFREFVATYCDVQIPRFRVDVWAQYSKLMIEVVAEPVATGIDSRDVEAFVETIKRYLYTTPLSEDHHHGCIHSRPFIKNDKLWIFAEKFIHWTESHDERMTKKHFGKLAAKVGAKGEKVQYTTDGGGRSKRYVYDVTQVVGPAFIKELRTRAKNRQKTIDLREGQCRTT